MDTQEPVPLHSGDTVARDYANPNASGSHHRRSGEEEPPHPNDADSSPPERAPSPSASFTHESRSSSPSPSAKPVEDEGPTDFSHPAAVEEQRMIWLPKDNLGLVREIERDLESRGVLYSTEGAEMDNKGHVNVTMAPPEDVQRNRSQPEPLPSPDDLEEDDMRVMSGRAKGSGGSKV